MTDVVVDAYGRLLVCYVAVADARGILLASAGFFLGVIGYPFGWLFGELNRQMFIWGIQA